MKTIIYYSNNDDGTRCGYVFFMQGKKYSDIGDAKHAPVIVANMVRHVKSGHGGRPLYEIRNIPWDEFLKKR